MNNKATENSGKIDKSDPRYIEACVKQLPSSRDEKETRIRELAQETFLTTPFAKDVFTRVHEAQLAYLKDVINDLNQPAVIHNKTQEAIKTVAEIANSQVVEGQEVLDGLPKGKPVILATNHLGTFKLSKVNPQTDLGIDIKDYDMMYPNPLYAAPLAPVAQALGDNLYYTGFDFPAQFGTIFDSAGFVPISPPVEGEETGGLSEFTETFRKKMEEHENAAIIHFPEGGTSGKRSGKGLYDLERFKKGIFVVASELGLPVLPVATYFNPEKGFELKVFPVVNVEKGLTPEQFDEIAEKTRQEELEWLKAKSTV